MSGDLWEAPAIWPLCTVVGCWCERTWHSVLAAGVAIEHHAHEWILAGGNAVCRCHHADGFPCDRFVASWAAAGRL